LTTGLIGLKHILVSKPEYVARTLPLNSPFTWGEYKPIFTGSWGMDPVLQVEAETYQVQCQSCRTFLKFSSPESAP
jgi:hypothetical protein